MKVIDGDKLQNHLGYLVQQERKYAKECPNDTDFNRQRRYCFEANALAYELCMNVMDYYIVTDVQPVNPLVKVEERVPTVSGNYLCYLSNGEFEVLYFDRGIEDDEYNTEYPFGVWNTYPSDDGGECREWIEVLEVTHWMALPESPERGER